MNPIKKAMTKIIKLIAELKLIIGNRTKALRPSRIARTMSPKASNKILTSSSNGFINYLFLIHQSKQDMGNLLSQYLATHKTTNQAKRKHSQFYCVQNRYLFWKLPLQETAT